MARSKEALDEKGNQAIMVAAKNPLSPQSMTGWKDGMIWSLSRWLSRDQKKEDGMKLFMGKAIRTH